MAKTRRHVRKFKEPSLFERALASVGAVGICLALVLSVSRCSPLTSSIAKRTPQPSNPVEDIRLNPGTPPVVHVFRYQTVVLNTDSSDLLPGGQTTGRDKVFRLTDEQLTEFKANGTTELDLDLTPEIPADATPDIGKGIFKVSLSRSQAEALNLGRFETDLRPTGQGLWQLSIPVSADTRVSQIVREYLLEISVSVGVDAGA
jgi:hypothetical protein